jgi:hypothetical protein
MCVRVCCDCLPVDLALTASLFQLIDRVMLVEDLTQGHTVAAYQVSVQTRPGSSWQPFSSGEPIGTKRIDLGKAVSVTSVRLTIGSTFVGLQPSVTLFVFSPCP